MRGEERGGGHVEADRFATVEFGADGVEIHEPALEQRTRHRLQRCIHSAIQLDLVVQRAKHRCDGFLLGEGWKVDRYIAENLGIDRWHRCPDRDSANVLLETFQAEDPRQELRANSLLVDSNSKTASREQPTILFLPYKCTPINRPDATENYIPILQRVT